MIRTQGLTQRFGNNYALHNVDIHVQKRSIYGLLGSNGAGKTTFLSLVAGLQHPTYGTIYYDGHSMSTMDKRKLGLMPQHAGFPREEKVFAYLRYIAGLRGLSPAKAHREVLGFLEDLGMDYRMDAKFGTLSNGMLKLINIAQAFIAGPEVILLDEPMAGLDPKVSVRVLRFLRENKKGRTYVICSHHLSVIEDLCTHVGILHKGYLMIQSPVAKLRDISHVINLRVDRTPKRFVEKLRLLRGVKNVLVDESSHSIRIQHSHDVLPPLMEILKDQKIQLLSLARGERLNDFFLKYL